MLGGNKISDSNADTGYACGIPDCLKHGSLPYPSNIQMRRVYLNS